jgi:DNA polymerase delta subunit 2
MPELQGGSSDEKYDALDAMQMTLELRHICPTSPDTLRSYPRLEADPFVIDECPHIYFSGNQEAFGERLLIDQKSKQQIYRQGVKLISVPSFQRTRSIVLMDLGTLQCYEVSFGLSEGIIPVRDSAMIDVSN